MRLKEYLNREGGYKGAGGRGKYGGGGGVAGEGGGTGGRGTGSTLGASVRESWFSLLIKSGL